MNNDQIDLNYLKDFIDVTRGKFIQFKEINHENNDIDVFEQALQSNEKN